MPSLGDAHERARGDVVTVMSTAPDPFAGITPIGVPAALRLSRREKGMRAHADHSAGAGPATLHTTDPATGQPKEARERGRRRMRLKPTMTVAEALAMVERVARRAYRPAMAPEEVEVIVDGVRRRVRSAVREQDRKHAATSLGIAIDKWTMLSGRPTQIHEVREVRQGMKALALRVLQGGGGAAAE